MEAMDMMTARMTRSARSFASMTFTAGLLLTLMTLVIEITVADECGTKFTDLISSAVLAQAIIKGSIRGFNPMSPATRTHSANVTIGRVYKGDRLVSAMTSGDVMFVQRFGQEDRDACVASSAIASPEAERIFFLRQTPTRGEMQMSAFPVLNDASVVRQIKRSLCSTCIRPPNIRRVVCKDCAKPPVVKSMKTKKVKMGRRARLRCTARAKPHASFSWTKDGIPVVSGSGGITIRETPTTSSLHFRRTFNAHAGLYMCKAENELGKMEKGVSLELTKPRAPAPAQSGRFPQEAVVNMLSSLSRGQANLSTSRTHSQQHSSGVRGQASSRDRHPVSRSEGGFFDINNPHDSPPPAVATLRPRTDSTTTTTATTTSSTLPTTTTPSASTTTHSSTTSTTTTSRLPPRGRDVRRPPSTNSRTKYRRKDKLKNRLQNRQLKTIVCKEKGYCLHGGRCKFVVKLGVRFCQCRQGFAGRQCEIKV